ncbi:MAG: ABC transporter, permease protein, partial [Parcubacteria group bacterium GW2011_GWB1_44_7]
AVSPEYQQRFQIVSTVGNNTNSLVIGAVPAYETVRNVSVGVGSFITEQHLRSMGRVAVVGATVASDLFGEEEPLGKTIRVNRVIFKVIGVMEAKGSSGFFNADDMVIVPLSTMQKILSGAEHLSLIAVSVLNKDEMPLVQSEASSLLAARHRVTIDNPDFSIVSQADIVGALTQVTDTFTIFLASIAGISLLVGGIGIMNMMLTTVTERTREIGLRKALGAKNRDISAQFLAEAIVLTVIGGVVGVILGWLISKTVSQFAGIATEVSLGAVLLAFGVSAGIGIVFGYYPARRASRLNPIEALRYE